MRATFDASGLVGLHVKDDGEQVSLVVGSSVTCGDRPETITYRLLVLDESTGRLRWLDLLENVRGAIKWLPLRSAQVVPR